MEKVNFEKMGEKALLNEVTRIKKELFDLRLNLAAGQVKDYSQFKKLKKDAARALTFLKLKSDSKELKADSGA